MKYENICPRFFKNSMYIHIISLTKLENFRKTKIDIAHHHTPNSICMCILPHVHWKYPERACINTSVMHRVFSFFFSFSSLFSLLSFPFFFSSGHDQEYETPLWTLNKSEKNYFANNYLHFHFCASKILQKLYIIIHNRLFAEKNSKMTS